MFSYIRFTNYSKLKESSHSPFTPYIQGKERGWVVLWVQIVYEFTLLLILITCLNKI